MGMDPLWAQVTKYHELCLDLPHKRQGSKPFVPGYSNLKDAAAAS